MFARDQFGVWHAQGPDEQKDPPHVLPRVRVRMAKFVEEHEHGLEPPQDQALDTPVAPATTSRRQTDARCVEQFQTRGASKKHEHP